MTSRMDTMIAGVEGVIGYTFTEHPLLWEALQAAGSEVYSISNRPIMDGNKNLALMGDGALKLVLATEGYERGAARGPVHNAIATVGSNANLATVGRFRGLDAFVNNNPSQVGISAATMATTVEAILGAVYLDSGKNLDTVRTVMHALGLTYPIN